MMYIQNLKNFYSSCDRNGISSVDMIKIAHLAGVRITRARLLELVEAGIIPKPLMLNDSIGKGKRMSFNFDALTKLMIHLLVTKLVDGITKGSRFLDKDSIIAAGYRLSDSLGNDIEMIDTQGAIKAMLLACQLVPVDLGRLKANEAKKTRILLVNIALAHAFVKTLLYASDIKVIALAWSSFKKHVMNNHDNKLSIDTDSNFDDGLAKLASQVGIVQNMIKNDKSGLTQEALITCAQIICALGTDSGWITSHINDCLKASFNTSIFEGNGNIDKLLSLAILKLS